MAGVGPYMNRADFRALDDRLRAAHFRLLAAHGHVLIPPPPPVPQPVPMRAPVPEPAPVHAPAPAPAPVPAQLDHIPPPFLADVPRHPRHQEHPINPNYTKDNINELLRNSRTPSISQSFNC